LALQGFGDSFGKLFQVQGHTTIISSITR
jgi:hypothetical protein